VRRVAFVTESADNKYAVRCPRCTQVVTVTRRWIGEQVRCPHCELRIVVPEPAEDGHIREAGVPPPVDVRAVSFACPRCDSVLESSAGLAGQTGRCPTCGARFVIPADSRGRQTRAQAIDQDDADPVPMHAYAASGRQAPQIVQQPDGATAIRCPRCGAHSDIDANNCAGCGAPFSTEGVPRAYGGGTNALATFALVFGLIGLPLNPLFVFGGLAVVLGMASWLLRMETRPSGVAIAGMLLGLLSLGLGVLHFLP
jgi:uncharacterized C2H2 Zn-finger protein